MDNKITLGTKLYGNYGAMSPIYYGIVVDIDENKRVTMSNDENEEFTVELSEIKFQRQNSGSPIGVYYNELDAY